MGNNGKENGNYYNILGFIWGIMEKKMETIGIIQDLYRGMLESCAKLQAAGAAARCHHSPGGCLQKLGVLIDHI